MIYSSKWLCNTVEFHSSWAPDRYGSNLIWVCFKFISSIDIFSISCKIVLRWMPQDLTDDSSMVMVWCCKATSHYLNQCWPSSMRPYGISWPQCVNSLWPSDTIWWHITWSTLVQVMACCLSAPSHYLNQCSFISSKVSWHSSRDHE